LIGYFRDPKHLGMPQMLTFRLQNVAWALSPISDRGENSAADERFKLSYDVCLPFVWSTQHGPPPGRFQTVVPAFLDTKKPWGTWSQAFDTKYKTNCSQGIEKYAASNLPYYFTPDAASCSFEEADISRIEINVRPSTDNVTFGRSPDYQRIWQDNQLSFVVIFGRSDLHSRNDDKDLGALAHKKFLEEDLEHIFEQKPEILSSQAHSNLRDYGANEKKPAVIYRRRLRFELGQRRVIGTVYLAGDPQDVHQVYEQEYATESKNADVVIYHGHESFGGNVNYMAWMTTQDPDQYQIYFLNTCMSYPLINIENLPAFRPSLSGSQYSDWRSNPRRKDVDLILTSQTTPFSSDGVTAVVRSLVTGTENYNQILGKLPAKSHPLVLFEDDNPQ